MVKKCCYFIGCFTRIWTRRRLFPHVVGNFLKVKMSLFALIFLFVYLFIFAFQVRDIQYNDFRNSLKVIRPSLSPQSLKFFVDWNSQYGSSA